MGTERCRGPAFTVVLRPWPLGPDPSKRIISVWVASVDLYHLSDVPARQIRGFVRAVAVLIAPTPLDLVGGEWLAGNHLPFSHQADGRQGCEPRVPQFALSRLEQF